MIKLECFLLGAGTKAHHIAMTVSGTRFEVAVFLAEMRDWVKGKSEDYREHDIVAQSTVDQMEINVTLRNGALVTAFMDEFGLNAVSACQG